MGFKLETEQLLNLHYLYFCVGWDFIQNVDLNLEKTNFSGKAIIAVNQILSKKFSNFFLSCQKCLNIVSDEKHSTTKIFEFIQLKSTFHFNAFVVSGGGGSVIALKNKKQSL